MTDRLEAARDRVAELVERVHRAHAAQEAAADDASRRGADAELRLLREALAQARADLVLVERQARGDAQARFERELRDLAARIAADVDRVLAGALDLHRLVSLGEARGLRVGSERKPTLPRDLERGLAGWRDRLRRVAAGRRVRGQGFDDAA